MELDNLGHAYVRDEWLFRHCTLSLRKGEVLAILAPNGRGKTTLLKILLGVLQPTEGRAILRGIAAFVPQLFQVSFDYTSLDMVLMGRARKVGLFSQPDKDDITAAEAALERIGIAHLSSHPFHQLSGGERQLVILARTLVSDADVLILDEPTSALDLHNQATILEQICTLAKRDGMTIVMTTHHPHHALSVADRALLMFGQAECRGGSADEMLREDLLSDLYSVPLKRLSFEHNGRSVETFAPILLSK